MDNRLADRTGAMRGAFPASYVQPPDAESILAGIADGIIALDNDWRLVYANQAATRIWGRDLTMFMGMSIHDALGIAEDNKFRLAYVASKHNGEAIVFSGYSEIFAAWVDVRGYPHADGYVILFRPAAPDRPIAPRTENERQRETARSINQRIFDTSLDLILVVDRHGIFLRVSPSAWAILGYRPEEIVGRNAKEFVFPDDLGTTRDNMRGARRGRTPRNFECRYVHKNGHPVQLAWTGIWSEPDQQYFFIGRDMTERVALEAQLRQAQKMEAVGQMAGGVAHDFNNILTAVIGNLSLVRLPEDDANRPLLAAAEQAAARAADLTGKLLGYARRNQLVFAPAGGRRHLAGGAAGGGPPPPAAAGGGGAAAPPRRRPAGNVAGLRPPQPARVRPGRAARGAGRGGRALAPHARPADHAGRRGRP